MFVSDVRVSDERRRKRGDGGQVGVLPAFISLGFWRGQESKGE